ncbi:hypothetical protein PV327_000829 [Microctonus hyperodae]|uniref:Xylulose kinase n=1 Tax=Microctonus hyperodae TaxID=165561 RepID=A0AA39G719_MICHY|nr:hypothetical protein PV327_000829 [Microctonus hyperodae]
MRESPQGEERIESPWRRDGLAGASKQSPIRRQPVSLVLARFQTFQLPQKEMGETSGPTYLGLDLSTQQLKAVVVDDELQILYEANVEFDNDLPEFRTHGGVNQKKDAPGVASAPCLMWVKALDMLLDKLRVCGVDFSKVRAISGCAQELAKITGSRAYERFSGAQIAKIWRTRPDVYANSERICLVSNFVATLLIGNYAPIDYADGSGMNLLDIHIKDWNNELLMTVGPDLRDRLGDTVPSFTNLAPIATYYVERFGFPEQCRIIAFTGDNPASLIGMRLKKGDLACSLGTSDTLFLWLDMPKTLTDGHILCNPIDNDAFMGMLCFKNGSLTRTRIRDSAAGASWQLFDELLDSTPRGNFGNLALYFDAPEILPPLVGDHRYNKADEKISRYSSKEVEVRALIEGQFIAKRAYAEDTGFVICLSFFYCFLILTIIKKK